LRFQIFALALPGFHFHFRGLISPYTQTRAAEAAQPQIRMAVAAERFLRYSAWKSKEVIDYV